jgi:hypothetical protein
LFAKNLGAIDPARECLFSSETKRTNASRDINALPLRRALDRYARRGAIDLRHAILQSEAREPDRIRAERVRLDYSRTAADVSVMNPPDPIRFSDAQFFETSLERNPVRHQQRPNGAVAAKDIRLQFFQ